MIKNLINRVTSAVPAREEGQGTIEYILVLGVVVVGLFTLVAWGPLGTALEGALDGVSALFGSDIFA